ncbi:MAG: hypothetical protein WBV61_09125 [Rhodanobacteraceae bacterium]
MSRRFTQWFALAAMAIVVFFGARWIARSMEGTRSFNVPSATKPLSRSRIHPPAHRSDPFEVSLKQHVPLGAPTAQKSVANPLPLGPFGANIDELTRLANAGDAAAAEALAEGYRKCRWFKPPKSAAALAKQAEKQTAFSLEFQGQIVDQLVDFAKKHGVDIARPADPPTDKAYAEVLKRDQQQVDECTGVPAVSYPAYGFVPDPAYDGATRAVELGDHEAGLGYWQQVLAHARLDRLDALGHERALALAALARDRDAGDPRALLAIGNTLLKGFAAEPDPFYAYAYFSAASHMMQVPLSQLPWMNGNFMETIWYGTNTTTYIDSLLRDAGASLDAQQKAQASRIGDELYRSCCEARG